MSILLSDLGLNSTQLKSFSCKDYIQKVSASTFKNNTTVEEISILSAGEIEDETFEGCVNLTSLELPGISEYTAKLFGNSILSSLCHLKINEGTQDIHDLLHGLQKLSSIELPNSMRRLESGAFSGCESLNTIVLNKNFELEEQVFVGASNISTLVFAAYDYIKDYGLRNISKLQNLGLLKKYSDYEVIGPQFISGVVASEIAFENFGDNIQVIKARSFLDCHNLQTLNLSNAIFDTLEEETFSGCISLQNLELPNTITSIKLNALCDVLKKKFSFPLLKRIDGYQGQGLSFTIDSSQLEYIGPSAFYLADFTDQTLNLDNLVTLMDGAFRESNVRSVICCSNLDIIPENCFFRCNDLESIDLYNVKTIKDHAFYQSNLKKVSLKNIKEIGKEAFSKTNICFDDLMLDLQSAQIIGDRAFSYCDFISRVVFKEIDFDNLGTKIFDGCKEVSFIDLSYLSNEELNSKISDIVGSVLINVESSDKYYSSLSNAWEKLVSLFGLEKSTDVEFKLKDITITKDQTHIEFNCLVYEDPDSRTKLIGIHNQIEDSTDFYRNGMIPSSVLSVLSCSDLENCWKNNTKISQKLSIDFSNTINIGDSAFAGTNWIKDIYGSEITSFGSESFASCYYLESISQFDKSNIRVIQPWAFSNCSSLVISKFPKTIKTIGEGSFFGCSNLKQINFEKCVELNDIQSLAFSFCSKMTSIKFPKESNLSCINPKIFDGCDNLKKITIYSNGLQLIHDNSFIGIADNASVYLIGNSDKVDAILSVDDQDLSSLNNIESPIGTKFFRSANDKYPSYWTKTSDMIVKINHTGFQTAMSFDDANPKINLVGFSTEFEEDVKSKKNYISKDNFKNIDSISNSAFNGSEVKVIELPKDLAFNIQSETFSKQNCPNLQMIQIDDQYSEKYDEIIKDFTKNNNLQVTFTNGIANFNAGFTSSTDIFRYTLQTGVNTIYGVNEENVPVNGNVIIDSMHKVISSGALFLDEKIKTLDTNQISSIEDLAISGNASISSIHLTNKLIKIGKRAFEDSSVREINIPSSIKTVDGFGLNKNHNLQNLVYDEGVVEILPSAMINCAGLLSSISFPTSLQKLGEYAFAETQDQFPRLDRINLGNAIGLTTIEKYTFFNSIRSYENDTLVLPPNVLSVFDKAFAYDPLTYTQSVQSLDMTPSQFLPSNAKYLGLSSFAFNHFKDLDLSGTHIEEIDSYAFAFPMYQYQVSEIPRSIKKIGFNAFKGNKILNPENVKKNIFTFDKNIYDLSDVFGVEIDEKFSSFNQGGFTDFTVLSAKSTDYCNGFAITYQDRVHFCPANLSIDIINRRLLRCSQDSTSALVQSYLTSINQLAFYNCSVLTSVVMDEGLEILPSAFYNCENLEFFNSRDSIYHINYASDYEFYNCKKLSNVRLLSTANSVGEYAFFNNDAVEDFQVKSDSSYKYYDLSSVGNWAFASCDNLTSFSFGKAISSFGDHVFDYCPEMTMISFKHITSKDFVERFAYGLDVSSAIISKFEGVRSDYKCRIVFSDCVYTNDGYPVVDNEQFTRLRLVNEVDGLSAVSSINYQAFINSEQDYLNLSSIYQVDQFAFCDVEKLESISFLPNLKDPKACLTHIGDYAFSGCKSLYNFNNSKIYCETIGSYAFANDRYISELQIDVNKIWKIGHGAFYGTSLYDLSFINCSGLNVEYYVDKIKTVIGFSGSGEDKDRNPLQLPETCTIWFKDVDGNAIGKYDYVFNDLLRSNVDINRNQLIYVDKQKQSIKPLLVVKAADEDSLPIIALNSFHVNIIGRWK